MKCFCAETRRAARLLTRHYEEHLRPCGLTPAQFELLAWMQGRPGASQGELAEMLAVDQTTLSRGLRLLLARGWIVQASDTADRRQVRYRLTEPGGQQLQKAMGFWRAAQETVAARLAGDAEATWAAVEALGRAMGTPSEAARSL